MDTKGLSRATLLLLVVVPILLIGVGSILLFPTLYGGQQSQVSSQTTTALTGTTSNANSGGNPQNSTWSKYLGYIPQGYTVTQKQSNAPTFPCPTGMNSAQCQQFQATCGNGVCDPNETCSSCSIDCAAGGNSVCDPYTGRPSAAVGVCQLSNQYNATK